jgi:predicted Zn-dependent protease
MTVAAQFPEFHENCRLGSSRRAARADRALPPETRVGIHGAEATTLIARSFHSLLAGAGALALLGTSALLEAQPARRPAHPDAKWMLVEVFKAEGRPEKELGLKAADAMRRRIGREIPSKEVYLVPKEEMTAILEASGFPSDVPLEPHDARALASQLRADEYIIGEVMRGDTSYTVSANLVLTRDNALQQPLGEFTSKKYDDAIELLAKELKVARAQLVHEQACVNAARQQTWDAAAAAAREGIAAYPNAVLARVCLANVMANQKASPEEMLKISREIVDIAPTSRPGLAIKAQAFRELDMQDSAVVTLTTLLATNPNDARLQKDVIEAISSFGNPRIARPIVEDAVAKNPGDADLQRLRWLILLAVRDYKEAFEAGEELVRLDTAFADTTYFIRTAAAYAADSQPQKAAETAARGVAKFADNGSLNYTLVAALRTSGQTQQALEVLTKATSAGVDVEDAGLLRATLYNDLGDIDGALNAIRESMAKGDSSSAIVALSIGNSLYQKAAADSTVGFDKAIEVLKFADEVNKGEQRVQAKFLYGASNALAARALVQQAAASRDCDAAKKAKDYLVEAQINLPAGGSFAPQQAQQLIAIAMQLDGFADQVIAAYCK